MEKGEPMPQVCKICQHPERQAIDGLLIEGWPSLRAIAAQYVNVSKDSLFRHYQRHLPDDQAAEDAPTPDNQGETGGEARHGCGSSQQKKAEHPRQDAGCSAPPKTSEEPEATEARYQAFIERWRRRVMIPKDEIATWPYEAEELSDLTEMAYARGDLYEFFSRHIAQSPELARRFVAQ